jgi:hypothetical protein
MQYTKCDVTYTALYTYVTNYCRVPTDESKLATAAFYNRRHLRLHFETV